MNRRFRRLVSASGFLAVVAVGLFQSVGCGRCELDEAVKDKALNAWRAIPTPGDGPRVGNAAPRKHTKEFYAVMEAFCLKHGDPVEDFIAVFGEPDRIEPVRWYLVKGVSTAGDGKTMSFWTVFSLATNFVPSNNGMIEAKAYYWKNDHYYWPRPAGE
jgi:hypothetical protein